MPPPTRPDARFYGTSDLPNTVERVAGKAQDVLERERHREHAGSAPGSDAASAPAPAGRLRR
jgi:hypothetical protein